MRRIASVVLVGASFSLAACRADDASAPPVSPSANAAPSATRSYPWQHGNNLTTQSTFAAEAKLAQCTRRDAQFGAAIIGSNGGTLIVGQNTLVVPPGALTKPTLITGYVPATDIASIHFEPEGLRFNKPAGLRINASGCAISGTQPSILYLDDQGNVLERIDAVYSNWWKTVAAPISHFSVYAIGV